MFEGILQPWHIIIVIGVLLLVLAPKKIPELGHSLGKSITGFKRGLSDARDEVASAVEEAKAPQPANVAPAAIESAPIQPAETPVAESSTVEIDIDHEG